MTTTATAHRIRAFTFWDLIITVAGVGVMLGLILLAISSPRVRASRINCVNNLKQIGLAFKIYAGDNNDHFPMAISASDGGTMALTGPDDLFRHFQIMSNDLSAPKVLICPEDTRQPALSFTNISDQHVSYFVNLDADDDQPLRLLSGDRNLTTNGVAVKSHGLTVTTNTVLGWTKNQMHSKKANQPCGNIGLADGSVQQITSAKLTATIAGLDQTNRLLLP